MDGSWSTPGAPKAPTPKPKAHKPCESNPVAKVEEEEKYYALVVDSGAIIKHSGFSTLHNSATKYVTTQGVIDEIRDAKARHHLESLPFKLEVREPSAEAIQAVLGFSKKTGDYASLSSVDLNVLGLLYDMEKEGCSDMSHIRKEPKRILGEGKVTLSKNTADSKEAVTPEPNVKIDAVKSSNNDDTAEEAKVEDSIAAKRMDETNSSTQSNAESNPIESVPSTSTRNTNAKMSWAQMVNSSASPTQPSLPVTTETVSFDSEGKEEMIDDASQSGGQFSDAEDDESIAVISEDDELCNNGEEKEDESDHQPNEDSLLAESLGTTCNIIDEQQKEALKQEREDKLRIAAEAEEKRKQESLKPISRDGKIYNSFRKYQHIVTSSGIDTSNYGKKSKSGHITMHQSNTSGDDDSAPKESQSRVIGSAFAAFGQDNVVDDDGEGWITSSKDIVAMKASGALEPGKMLGEGRQGASKRDLSMPQKHERAACATTDFAMQNVILQMSFELLSVDGVKVRKLKSWVTRCGSCFRIYTGSENDGKKIFCSWCGSDALQRVAASVDGKTGRLKLHLKKNYQYNLRGTQYNLPKPGKGDRFKGDLLLREDQLMYGTWNQTYKKNKGARASTSIFGNDVAALCSDLTKRDDIRVGFGRKNPNASKFGRERRGKKKKSANEKACGLRRY